MDFDQHDIDWLRAVVELNTSVARSYANGVVAHMPETGRSGSPVRAREVLSEVTRLEERAKSTTIPKMLIDAVVDSAYWRGLATGLAPIHVRLLKEG